MIYNLKISAMFQNYFYILWESNLKWNTCKNIGIQVSELKKKKRKIKEKGLHKR